jgi:hypothetical protein
MANRTYKSPMNRMLKLSGAIFWSTNKKVPIEKEIIANSVENFPKRAGSNVDVFIIYILKSTLKFKASV